MSSWFLSYAVHPDGYPNLAFEAWYQRGLSCFLWKLPRPLARQAFSRLCEAWSEKGRSIEMWHVRAFIHGYAGGPPQCPSRLVPDDYEWPTPCDASWKMVICAYPDGACEIDFVHSVSRRFWSEDNEFPALPSSGRSLLSRYWFIEMGFDVIDFNPTMAVQVTTAQPPLKLVAAR
uniref:hypothetical protein n=1 Tax=Cupriavidus gilardii TaxID=82541 RepID=UPI00247B17CB|nr:hypothetical protein [Cupriavidus gilardii]